MTRFPQTVNTIFVIFPIRNIFLSHLILYCTNFYALYVFSILFHYHFVTMPCFVVMVLSLFLSQKLRKYLQLSLFILQLPAYYTNMFTRRQQLFKAKMSIFTILRSFSNLYIIFLLILMNRFFLKKS